MQKKIGTMLLACVLLTACGLEIGDGTALVFGARALPPEPCEPEAHGESDAGPGDDAGEEPSDAGPDVESDASEKPPATCEGRCVPGEELPAGWIGPVLVSDPVAPASLPLCPIGYVAEDIGGEAWEAPPATCAPCTCGESSGGSCSYPKFSGPIAIERANTCTNVLEYGPGDSSGAIPNVDGWTPGECVPFSGQVKPARAMYAYAPNQQQWQSFPGYCMPSGGEATIAPPTWTLAYRACVPTVETPGTCSDGEACGPASPSFRTCVMRAGLGSCPNGYPEARTVARALQDKRSCTACTCGPETGADCRWSFQPFADTACTIPVEGISLVTGPDMAQTCVDFPPVVIMAARGTPESYTVGTCAPFGGEPTGGVFGVDMMTVCCAAE